MKYVIQNIFLILLLSWSLDLRADSPAIINPGSDRMLFFDDFVLAEMNGLARIWHPPEKYSGNPILLPEKPWEGISISVNSLHYDESGKIYKLRYSGHSTQDSLPGYEDFDKVPQAIVRGMNSVLVPGMDIRYKPKDKKYVVYSHCLATSSDGIHFDRPAMGLVSWPGSGDPTNLDPSLGGFCDPSESDPAKRYKAFLGASDRSSSVSAFFSPDGIHWTAYPENPIIKHSVGGTIIQWDPASKQYVGIARPRALRFLKDKKRILGRMTSPDFIHWTDPNDQIVLAPDDRDGPDVEFYTMPFFQYENVWIGFLEIFYNQLSTRRRFGIPLTERLAETQLAFSRDTIHWNRPEDRSAFLLTSPPGAWDDMEIHPRVLIPHGDQLWIYYSARITAHGNTAPTGRDTLTSGREVTGGIGLAILRRDGFVSLHANEEPGIFLTRPLQISSESELFINASSCGGEVAVEVLDSAGEPLPGLSRSDCTIFTGDAVDHPVVWKSGKTIQKADSPIRLKFYLQNADLFSFHFIKK